MRKNELIEKIAQESGVKRKDVEIAIDGMIKYIKSALADGHTVYLRGFGCFSPFKRKPKAVRNFHHFLIFFNIRAMFLSYNRES